MEKPWLSAYEEGVSPALSYPEQSLSDLLGDAARRYPDKIAANFVLKYMLGGRFSVGGKLSYRQLSELVDRMATALYQLGVRKGDRVGLMLPNSPHYIISFFAAMRLGAVVVNINPTYTTAGYPNAWTQFTATIPQSAPNGRLAFRYFVENGGPNGSNSDYIGVDTFAITAVPEPTALGAIGFWMYWQAIRGGLTRTRCALRHPRLVLGYLALACAGGLAGIALSF